MSSDKLPPGTKPLRPLAGHKEGAPADSGLSGHTAGTLGPVGPARMTFESPRKNQHLFGNFSD